MIDRDPDGQEAVVRIRDLRYPGLGAAAGCRLDCPGATVLCRSGLTALVGENGTGKTTLLSVLAGELADYTGSVEVLGTRLEALSRRRPRQRLTRRIGLVPQYPRVIPRLTVRANLDLVLRDNGVRSEATRRLRTDAALRQVGIQEQAGSYPHEISGGQLQRLQIAKVLVRDVELILADEPTSQLDVATRDGVVALLRRLSSRLPILLVTHDRELAGRCDRVFELRRPGGLCAIGVEDRLRASG